MYAKDPYQRGYILQKRPIIFRSLLTVASHTRNCPLEQIEPFQELYFMDLWISLSGYGVATMSRLLKIIGLFCKGAL